MRLNQLDTGSRARIMSFSLESERRVLRLENYGVTLGSIVRLLQKKPSLVIEIGGTQLALDNELAQAIHVQPEING